MSDLFSKHGRVRIIATIGPACEAEETVVEMVRAGMDVARLNFSHGTLEDHARNIRMLRGISGKMRQSIAILQDLQGVKIRTGPLREGHVPLANGRSFILTARTVPGDAEEVSVTWPDLPHNVRPDDQLLLDDGRIRLRVESVRGADIFTRVEQGGVLLPHKGINLPGVRLAVSALTEKDKQDLAFGLEQDVDAVAISFVRKPEDVAEVREFIRRTDPSKSHLPLIAKLERREALEQLEAILDAADGVMVARGDLGVETSPQDVPVIQKKIIERANLKSKLVITATQMLETMIANLQPTRAEASDVANAVFDGSDAVMLSGETAIGAHPVAAVQTMATILHKAEEHLGEWGRWKGFTSGEGKDHPTALAHAAAELAKDRKVSAIAVFTQQGRSARLMSKARPCAPILAFTPNPRTYRRLSMLWGVVPALVQPAASVEAMVGLVAAELLQSGPIQPGQQVILVASLPMELHGPPNFILLHTLQDQETKSQPAARKP
ncbi:MAG: pyruvate kinase [Anaerolineales bacterium]|nr:pyruvate kinase [Anaerolineales bacterium]